jgi:glycerophosphoryl diester phosphodiesterase
MRSWAFAFLASVLLFSPIVGAAASPLAHSHNDYEQPRPLLDALALGFDSIEADVWLVDDRLLVAHEAAQVQPGRTLEALYLDLLREWVQQPGRRSLILLIDVKTEAVATYAALDSVLGKYPDLSAGVRFIISGNRAREVMAAQAGRRAALDGRMDDRATAVPADLIPLVSDNWAKFFAWRGEGDFPAADRERLRQFVAQARAQRRLLRFWNTPNRPEVWRVLREAGVDVIGTDDLLALRRFLDTP